MKNLIITICALFFLPSCLATDSKQLMKELNELSEFNVEKYHSLTAL